MVLTVPWYDITLQTAWCHYFKGHWDTQLVFIFHFLLETLCLKSWLTSPSFWGFGRLLYLRKQKFQKELRTVLEIWNVQGRSKLRGSLNSQLKKNLIWQKLSDLPNKIYIKYKCEDCNKVDIMPNFRLFPTSHPLFSLSEKCDSLFST